MKSSMKPISNAVMAFTVAIAVPALAQTAADSKALSLEEIVVTARRVQELQQDVPVAITAMGTDQMEREAIDAVQDLQGRVPSLTINANSQMRNTQAPTLRGQGATYSASPGVILYYSEVPLPSDPTANNQGGPGLFFDVANLQVLKGSQGTLFGRNTTGGAMLIEPNKPGEEFEASLKADVSNYSGRGYEGVLNVPLVADTLLLRVAGQMVERDGFTKDVLTGKDYDNKDYWTGRAGLTWRPTEQVENYLLVYNTDSDDNGSGTVLEALNPGGLNCQSVNFFTGSTNCGQNLVAEQKARGIRKVQLSANPNDTIETKGLIDQFTYEINDDLTLRNIASYSTFKHHYRWDLDGSRGAFSDQNTPDSVDQTDLSTITEEIQLQGTGVDGQLTYVVGAFMEQSDVEGRATQKTNFVGDVVRAYEMTRESFATFAQGTLDLGAFNESLSGLNLTLGARYTTDDVGGEGGVTQSVPPGVIPQLPLGGVIARSSVDTDVSESAPTYTLGLDYSFDEHMVYAKVSRGYKAGGISFISVNPANFTFDPEFVTNYELGVKSDFTIGEMPTRLNSAVYYTDFTDMQKSGSDSFLAPGLPPSATQFGGATYNVGESVIQGVEIEGVIQPVDGLTLSASYAYTDAEYKTFDITVGSTRPTLSCSGQMVTLGGTADLSCAPFQGVAEHQYSLSALYEIPIDPATGEMDASITYTHTDERYSAQTSLPAAEPGAWLPAYWLVNGSWSWRNIMGSNFEASIYGTNLTDEEYKISNSNVWPIFGFQASIYSEPRIVGLKVGYSW